MADGDLAGLIARALALGILAVMLWSAAGALGSALVPAPVASAVAVHVAA